MPPESYLALKAFIQLICAITAVILNSLLIILIITKSPSKMGTYRYLMSFFCIISIVFAVLDIVLEPIIHSKGSAFLMVMDLRNRNLSPVLAEFLIDILCGCLGCTVNGIVVHFIYRFFALERQGRLRYFQWPYLLLWLLFPLFGLLQWTSFCWFLFSVNPTSSAYLKPIILQEFNIPIEHTVYAAAIFWFPDSILPPEPTPETSPRIHKGMRFNWNAAGGLINIVIAMSIAMSVITVYGGKSWMKIKELVKQGESKYTKNLQMQLYKALVAQTIIPVLLLFVPFGILFLGPLFLIDCSFLAVPLTFIYAIYPALDSLPTLLFVDSYRNTVGDFCCKTNRISDATTSRDQVFTRHAYAA